MSIINLNTAAIFNAIGGGSPLSIINSSIGPQYTIRDGKTGAVALEFSGMASIQSSGRAQITTAPVEKGKYQSMNKVKQPSNVRCKIIVTGLTGFSGALPNIFDLTFTSQSDVLKTIKDMLGATNTYDIETPKETLQSYDLAGHYYEVSSQSGVSMLTIYLDFEEVMQQMEVILSGPQAYKQCTKDEISQGTTGVGGLVKQAESKPSSLDELGKSWSSLKKSVGDVSSNVTKNVTSGLQSALKTVSEPAIEVANSAVIKAAEIAKNIGGTTT